MKLKVNSLTWLVLFVGLSPAAQAAQKSAQALATIKVVEKFDVVKVTDLTFPEAQQGQAADIVDPGSADADPSASFLITGPANRALTIVLPADGAVVMTTGGGGPANQEIAVNSFTSNALTEIGANGEAKLYVGATRAALAADQVLGNYEGTFLVDVAHQ